MKKIFDTPIKSFIGSSILILGIFLLISFIKTNKKQDANFLLNQEAELNQIKIKLSELENLIKGNKENNLITNTAQINEENLSPIKSVTFRMDSNDDRLRIYWSNGNKTDIPCTKEQSIWVCG
tara:strand:+ start:187 stop:555 length:369 start_codon:yes stop_codon:yes gene_type:complete